MGQNGILNISIQFEINTKSNKIQMNIKLKSILRKK